MDRSDHSKTYIPHVDAGMSYEAIRALAIKDGVPAKELRALMRELDRYILERDEIQANHRQAKESMWIGIAFCIIAGMMSLYGLLDSEGHYIYMVYSIFAGGILIFYNGWQKKKYLKKEAEEDI